MSFEQRSFTWSARVDGPLTCAAFETETGLELRLFYADVNDDSGLMRSSYFAASIARNEWLRRLMHGASRSYKRGFPNSCRERMSAEPISGRRGREPAAVECRLRPKTLSRDSPHEVDSSIKAGSAAMETIPTLEHESAAPRLVDEVNTPRMVSLAPCENCGSLNVLSTLETSLVIYWRCQDCGEISATEQGVTPEHID